MKLTLVSLFAAAATLYCAPLQAQQNSSAAETSIKPAKPIKEKKICRSEATTGSMLAMSTCHTAAQWNMIDKQNSANANNLRPQDGKY